MKTTSMLSQLAKVKGVTLCTLLVGIVAGVVNAVQPFLLKKVLDNLQALQPFSVILLVAAIISYTGLSALQEYLRAKIAYTVTADVRTRLARHLCEVPLSSFDDHPKGDLLARFGDDSVQVGKALNDGVVGACSAVLGFLFAFVGMLSIDVTLLISVLLCVGFGSVLSLLTSKTLEGKSLYAQEANGELMTAFDRIITALPVLKAYNAESLEGAKIVRSKHEIGCSPSNCQAVGRNYCSGGVICQPWHRSVPRLNWSIDSWQPRCLCHVFDHDDHARLTDHEWNCCLPSG